MARRCGCRCVGVVAVVVMVMVVMVVAMGERARAEEASVRAMVREALGEERRRRPNRGTQATAGASCATECAIKWGGDPACVLGGGSVKAAVVGAATATATQPALYTIKRAADGLFLTFAGGVAGWGSNQIALVSLEATPASAADGSSSSSNDVLVMRCWSCPHPGAYVVATPECGLTLASGDVDPASVAWSL